jgi:hypothetical protein
MITNPTYFLETMKRMYASRSGVMFRNEDGTFAMVLRCDSDITYRMAFDIDIVYDEDTDPTGAYHQLLVNECMETEEDVFNVVSFDICKDAEPTSEDVTRAIKLVNECHSYRLCPCNKYMIRDDHPMCFHCHMTATEADMKIETCTICHEETPRIGMKPQPCCKQYMHTRCIETWYNSSASKNPRCPICREPSVFFSYPRVL